ncbi:MAG: polymerase, sigma-24 subunit, subfamily [Pedosphaera sp.]|nr:polymerase, sigma-24 subunit, subfamily [Pedosphaera sp.]
MTDDGQLLRRYTTERSEDAFRELVTRHIDLVYSAAFRLAGRDSHLAQDITQNVFVDLARKASSLPSNVVLPGWLYRHACFTASKAVRTERRRQAREFTAMEMTELTHQPDANWEQIAPELEEAMTQLSEPDRDAIILRFFKRQDFRAVGATLGISEDTAQKRVSRALDKLRTLLGQRGVTLPATALATVLTAEAVTAAPAGLTIPIVTASLAGATATGVTVSLMKLLAMTKLKTAVAAALVVAAVTIPLLQNQSLAHLRQENLALRQQSKDAAQLRAENERLAKVKADAEELERLRRKTADLARLRGEVTSLRRANQELIQAQLAKSRSRENRTPSAFIPGAQLADAGLATPEASLQTLLWAAVNGKKERVEQAIDKEVFLKMMADKFHEINPDFNSVEDIKFNLNLTPAQNELAGFQILSQELDSPDKTIIEVAVTANDGTVETNHAVVNRVGEEWKVDMLSLAGGSGSGAGEFSFTNTADNGSEIVTKYKLPVDSGGKVGKLEPIP